MSRLTYKKPDGTWGMTNGFNMSEVPGKIYGALWKLKEYEDSELSPEQLKHIDALYLKKCQEVNELKLQIIKLERARAEICKDFEEKKQTNADRIRSMSDGELADMFHNNGSYVENGEPKLEVWVKEKQIIIDDSHGCILEWLQSEE